jgi:hypothetical protein
MARGVNYAQDMATTRDTRLAADEARRAMQHDAVRSHVESEVNAELEARAHAPGSVGEVRRIERAAGAMRANAVDEVVETEREVGRARGVARVSQVIGYVFFLGYALLATRFVLGLIGARAGAGFTKFIATVTAPLYAPFEGIVKVTREAEHVVMWPVLVAIAAYGLLHFAINRLLRVVATRQTAI